MAQVRFSKEGHHWYYGSCSCCCKQMEGCPKGVRAMRRPQNQSSLAAMKIALNPVIVRQSFEPDSQALQLAMGTITSEHLPCVMWAIHPYQDDGEDFPS
jgi:hypothetical protein